MAFTDPKTVTINAVAHSLAKVGTPGPFSTLYKEDNDALRMTVSHRYGKRKQSLLRFDLQKTAADPLISSQNIIYGMSVSLTVDRPLVGFTIVEQKQFVDGVVGFLTATSGADTTKFLGGEN